MAAFGCSKPIHADEDTPGEFVTPEKVFEWLSRGACLFADTREENEVLGGVIPGAMRMSAGYIMFPKPHFKKMIETCRSIDKPLVCYTDYGVMQSRCGLLCQFLAEQEDFPVERLFRLQGGLDSWKALKFPVCQLNDDVWRRASAAQMRGGGGGGSGAATAAPAAKAKAKAPPAAPTAQPKEPPGIRAAGGSPVLAGEAAVRACGGSGARVLISGLQSDAGRPLNGKEAVVQSYDSSKERYSVRIKLSSEERALKADNLTLLIRN